MDTIEYPILADTNYRIESTLGSGGSGIVYKAWHERLQKYVALKRISGQTAQAASRAEADMLKNLKHSGLPQVYDFLTEDSGVYTVMEFIPGQSFAQLLSSGRRFPQKQVIEWARELSGALAYLHGRKPSILHSDIKPANVMLTPEDGVCLIDFNVALLLDGINTNVIGRSHGYASPEQYGPEALPRNLRVVPKEWNPNPENEPSALPPTEMVNAPEASAGTERINDIGKMQETEYINGSEWPLSGTEQIRYDAAENPAVSAPQLSSSARERIKIRMDARSDIYSLGATLYHLLTGEKPAIATGEVKPLSAFQLGLSEAVIHIIEKCMERDPAKRFQTAAELHRAFCEIQKLDSRWKRQNAYKNTAVVILSALFVISGASAAYGWKRMGEEKIAAYNEWVHDIPQSEDDGSYNQAIALFPDKLDAYLAQALKICVPGSYEECTEYVADIMPRLMAFTWNEEDLLKIGDIFYVEGNAWFETERYPKAVASYEAATANNPANPEMFRDYAIALARCGYVDRAEELLAKVQNMTIGVDSIDLLKGEIAYAKHNDEEAAALFKGVIETSDNSYIRQRAYLICDRAYRRMPDKTAEEISLLHDALTDLPDNYKTAVKERLADALTRVGESSDNPDAYYREAAELFAELKAQGNISYATAQNIGLLYQRMGDFHAARSAFDELVSNFPEDYRPYMRLAYLVLEEQAAIPNDERDYGEALEWYEKGKGFYDERQNSEGDDMEMLTLISLMDELRQNGWL